MAHRLGKLSGWGDVGSSRLACHRPDGFFPVQLFLRGWERVLVTEEGPVDRLSLFDDAPFLLIVRPVGECNILCIPGSFRSRLNDPINLGQTFAWRKRTLINCSVS